MILLLHLLQQLLLQSQQVLLVAVGVQALLGPPDELVHRSAEKVEGGEGDGRAEDEKQESAR